MALTMRSRRLSDLQLSAARAKSTAALRPNFCSALASTASGLNTAVRTADNSDSLSVDLRQPVKVSENCQLIVEMSVVQCDSPRYTLGMKRFNVRVIGRAPLALGVGDEENVTVACKEVPQRWLGPRFFLASMVVEDSGKRAVPLRPVKKSMKH